MTFNKQINNLSNVYRKFAYQSETHQKLHIHGTLEEFVILLIQRDKYTLMYNL
jgi:hypothetical protein